MNASYSLVDEPWIPCRMIDGQPFDLGLRDTLVRAHEIAEVSHASPLVTSALLRLLLCVVHRVLAGPRTQDAWLATWKCGAFDRVTIESYLDRWHERFDLFHPAHPFFQVGEFVTLKGGRPTLPKPLSVLVHDLASANNTTLFDHSLDREAIARSPAWCVRRLLAFQAWALGGGVQPASSLGKHPNARHAPLAGKVQVFLDRPNLFETLVANLLILDALDEWCQAAGDLPVWERNEIRAPADTPTWPAGLCDYLTYPSRYVRLVPETLDGKLQVRGVHTAQGLFVPPDVRDPYTAWRPAKEGSVVLPLCLTTDRDLWRDAAVLFAWERSGIRVRRMDGRPRNFAQADTREVYEALGGDAVMLARVFGLASDQAKPLAWCTLSLPFQARLLREHELAGLLRDTLRRIDEAGSCLRGSFERLARSMLETEQKSADREGVGLIRNHLAAVCGFWPEVERGFDGFMRSLVDEPGAARRRWLEQAQQAAEDAFDRAVDSLPGRSPARLRAHVGAILWLRGALRRITRIEEAA
jgi:CRISPR system Cascade subunit CasA